MKKISKASGKSAWMIAEKRGQKLNPVFFSYNKRIIAHQGDVYTEGMPGDYGFCSPAVHAAHKQGGVWID